MCAGTTRRRGKKRGILLLPEEFAIQADSITQSSGKVAIVFGNERTGLTDEQLDECTLGVTIPSSDEFGSLNLSHAVQIDTTVQTIANSLQKIGFFSLAGRTDMEEFWRNLLSRSSMTESEAQYIEKIFTKAAGLASKNKSQPNT